MLAWSERKLIAFMAMPRRDKSLGDTDHQISSGLFSFSGNINKGADFMQWLKVFIAAFFEVFWVIGLKHADEPLSWAGTIICIAVSFYLMIMAGRVLPVGTVYAVFVGMGTAGTVLSEIIFFGEPLKLSKIILVFVLLLGVLGLKLVTTEDKSQGAESS